MASDTDTTRWTREMRTNPLPELGDRIKDRISKLKVMLGTLEEENADLRNRLKGHGEDVPEPKYETGASASLMSDLQRILSEREAHIDDLTGFLDELDEEVHFDRVSNAETRVQEPSADLPDLDGPTRKADQTVDLGTRKADDAEGDGSSGDESGGQSDA